MKRTLALILCLSLLFVAACMPTAFAATESNKYISSYSSAITLEGNGKIKINFSTFGTDYMDDIGATTILLYENGTIVKTYSAYNPLYSSTMLAHTRYYFYGYVYYDGTVGDTYYAVIVHYAGDSTGHGTEVSATADVVAT
jgi:hypothetical protein